MTITNPHLLAGVQAKLVPLEKEHVQGLFEAGNDSAIWAYMPFRVATVDDMSKIVDSALKAKEEEIEMPFTIIDQATGKIVGSSRYLDMMPAHRNLEIGWTWLSPSVQRTRINTECKYLLLRYAFEELGMVRVQLKADGRNERSQAAIARIGAKKEGVLRRHRILPDGYIRDTVVFSITDEEWPGVKERLEGGVA